MCGPAEEEDYEKEFTELWKKRMGKTSSAISFHTFANAISLAYDT